MNQMERLVVPWDFSEHSKAALQYVIRHFGGHAIKLICVLERPNPYISGFEWGPEAEEKSAIRCRDEFFELSIIPANCALHFKVAFGEPADEICEFADQVRADYIVMSTHGRTGIQKLMMGSVAEKVVSQSKSPVILLPAKWYEHQMPISSMIAEDVGQA